MNDLDQLMMHSKPTTERPLAGLTVLVVEDSRFACEAMRLLCLRSGARIRRADCLASARRHLQVYRPSVVVIDLGLPDGSGTELIEELVEMRPQIGVILGTSGDDTGQVTALTAGADGFLPKPIRNLATFQSLVLSYLPRELHPEGPRALPGGHVSPDPIAFRDDLAHVAGMLTVSTDEKSLDYATRFLGGVARSAHDKTLEEAAGALARSRKEGRPIRSNLAQLAGIVQERLAAGGAI